MSESVLQQGWTPVGQTLLAEYAATLRAQEGPGPRDYTTWEAIAARPSMRDLLPQLVLEHARLLHAADTLPHGGLCQGLMLKEALRRYETLWLPLLAHTAATAALAPPNGGAEAGERAWRALVPPLDVAFVWHLHRLRPAVYAQDVTAATRGVLYAAAAAGDRAAAAAVVGSGGGANGNGNGNGHSAEEASTTATTAPKQQQQQQQQQQQSSLITPSEVIARACTGADSPGGIMFAPGPLQAFRFSDAGAWRGGGNGGGSSSDNTDDDDARGAATARLWHSLHGSDEPFWPPRPRPDGRTAAYSSSFSADLGAAAVRQPLLMRQLLRPCWRRGGFLRSALDRYARWLLLLKRNPVALPRPVAPVDVALVWRAHASCLAMYAEDCQAILGAGRPLPEDRGAGEGAGDAGDAATLDRGEAGVWRLAWGECKAAWDGMYGGGGTGGGGGAPGSAAPFVVPGAAFASMDAALPGALEARAATHKASWRDDAAGGGSGEWRAGLHALYLDWLATGSGPGIAAVARMAAGPAAAPAAAPPKPKPRGGGLFACFACGAADSDDDDAGGGGGGDDKARRAGGGGGGDALVARVAAGFSGFQGLPHSSAHPYWGREGGGWVDPGRVLQDAGGAPLPGAEGPELDDDLGR
jgi:hypothetical protein